MAVEQKRFDMSGQPFGTFGHRHADDKPHPGREILHEGGECLRLEDDVRILGENKIMRGLRKRRRQIVQFWADGDVARGLHDARRNVGMGLHHLLSIAR